MDRIILDIAQELFDVWKEAKSSMPDNWDDETWENLPVFHKREYLLTAERIVRKVRIFYEEETNAKS